MTAGTRWLCLLLAVVTFSGCAHLQAHDVTSLLVPRLLRSEIVGVVAGFGTGVGLNFVNVAAYFYFNRQVATVEECDA